MKRCQSIAKQVTSWKSYENIYALKIIAWDSVSDTAPTFFRVAYSNTTDGTESFPANNRSGLFHRPILMYRPSLHISKAARLHLYNKIIYPRDQKREAHLFCRFLRWVGSIASLYLQLNGSNLNKSVSKTVGVWYRLLPGPIGATNGHNIKHHPIPAHIS